MIWKLDLFVVFNLYLAKKYSVSLSYHYFAYKDIS